MRRVDVNCPQSPNLHPYFDDELDAPRREAFAAHLPGCAECSGELEMQKALRTKLQEESFRYKAPAGLGRRIQSALGAAAPAPRPRYGLSAAAALLLGAAAGVVGTYLAMASKPQPAANLPRILSRLTSGH